MKKNNVWILGIFAVLVAGIITLFAVVLAGFGLFDGVREGGGADTPQYIAICINPQADGWQDIKAGMQQASAELGVAVEFIEHGFEQDRADASCIEMAVDSGAEGIAIYAQDRDLDEALEYAAKRGVAVAVLVNRYTGEESVIQIGEDAENIAGTMAEYIGGMSESALNAGLISDAQADDVRVGIFSEKISSITGGVKTAKRTGYYVFDAGESAKQLLSANSEINLICCMDANTTLGVAQSIVELNKVNSVSIVGSGISSEILNLIEKGVISATVSMDYKKIGEDAVKELFKQNGRIYKTASEISADVFIIDADNADLFTREDEYEG